MTDQRHPLVQEVDATRRWWTRKEGADPMGWEKEEEKGRRRRRRRMGEGAGAKVVFW